MKKKAPWKMGILVAGMVILLALIAAGCASPDGDETSTDPASPWTVTATEATWLSTNPYTDKHDGGWVYSAREQVLYAFYGNEIPVTFQPLHRINHVAETAAVATTPLYSRHGSHPVIDNTGSYIYLPPSQDTNQLERFNTVAPALETMAVAPDLGSFSHGAWKSGKLWIVLDNLNLYSYDPVANSWSASLEVFLTSANVAASGPSSSLIYVIVQGGTLFSYNVSTDATTALASHPSGFSLGGNSQFTWFGHEDGFLYAADTEGSNPAMYDIGDDTWHELTDPRANDNYSGHTTFDSTLNRLYVTGASDIVYYYQF